MIPKTVEVHTLKVGDKFVLEAYTERQGSIYLIYEMDGRGWAECVEMHSGKTFSFGREVLVYPVAVNFAVRRTVREEKLPDLTNKCGGCVHSTTEDMKHFVHTPSYVRCVCPDKKFARETSAYRPRTAVCCSKYVPKEGQNAT